MEYRECNFFEREREGEREGGRERDIECFETILFYDT